MPCSKGCHTEAEEKKILGKIKCLVDKLGSPCPPDVQHQAHKKHYMCQQEPRLQYQAQECEPPVITHVSLLELRPTSEYRRNLGSGQGKRVVYVNVDPPLSQHAYPPWGERDCANLGGHGQCCSKDQH